MCCKVSIIFFFSVSWVSSIKLSITVRSLSTFIGIAVGLVNHLASSPSTIVQAEGLDAEFLCEDPAGTIDWKLNETYLRNIDSSDGSIRREGRGSTTEALVVRAMAKYNNTDIHCVIFYTNGDGTVTVEQSEPAKLIIQGEFKLIYVHNVHKTHWHAAYT